MAKQLAHILRHDIGVPESDVAEALKTREEKGGSMGEILVQRKAITEKQLLKALSIQYEIPFWEKLPLENITKDFAQQVPIQFLKKYLMVPLNSRHQQNGSDEKHVSESAPQPAEAAAPGEIIIALHDPSKFQPLDDLVGILGAHSYQMVLSTKEEILSVINISYDLGRDSAQQLVQDMEENGSMIISEIEDTADLLDNTSDAPIIKLVNHILSQSVKARASDIHVEPYQNSFKVRYRVDGILYDLLSPPKWIQASLISRIKVMAKMNIAEKRLPQDGGFTVRVEGKILPEIRLVAVSAVQVKFIDARLVGIV